MKALLLSESGKWPEFKDFDFTGPPHYKKVEMIASALNRRDLWIVKGMYPGINYPIVLGSDGVGWYRNEKVIINPSHGWGDNQEYQGKDFRILGLPEHGTFAQNVYVDEKYIYPKPEHLKDLEAAALPLAGLTAYRALIKKAKALSGENILITGIGGGVAMFVLQFAMANEMNIFVTSGNPDKIDKALAQGAQNGCLYHSEKYFDNIKNMNPAGFDIVIDGTGGKDLTSLLRFCKPGARIVIYGGTVGNLGQINPQLLFWKQIKILGSTMGSDEDFREMLAFVNKHKIKPTIDSVYPLKQAKEAFQKMENSQQFGKIVLNNK